MPAVYPSSIGFSQQFFTNAGVPLAGGKLYTYVAGTVTPQATYTDNTGTVAQTNPIILDSGGRIPSGEVWLINASYKFVLADSLGNTITTWDNIPAPLASTTAVGLVKVGAGLAVAADGTLSTSAAGTLTLVSPSVQVLTAASGTYTKPAGVLYVVVRMVGAGGGGGAGTNGTAGGNTTFGAAFLTANGGGFATGNTPGAGGTATIGAGATGIAITGGQGGIGNASFGGNGAPSALGGGGNGGGANAGGYGAGGGASAANYAGGSAGGYIEALITTVAATYAFTVGAGGTAPAGAGAGGAGLIEVLEYRQ